jgi:ATP-binding cassette subfamily G (WHITE) protein 2 (SNQ2)
VTDVRTFPDAVKEFFLLPWYMGKSLLGEKPVAPKTILHSFDGAVRPGEMVLVLGRPGAGCSSFLKTIANQRGSFIKVEGDVQYAGIPAQEFGKRFAGEAAYNMEGEHRSHWSVIMVLTFFRRHSLSYLDCRTNLAIRSVAEVSRTVTSRADSCRSQ